jgi:tetratricopeptide (TPR) repeat protein
MKALEKDRNRRYETAKDFAADVQHYLADEPVLACPPSAGYRLGKFVRRHRGRVTAAAAMVVLLLAGSAVSTWQAVRATRAERETGKALTQVTAAQGQTFDALDVLTDDVLETIFARQPELDETEKGFLRKVLGFYEAFTQQSGETAEARFVRARGHAKVARLRALLGGPRDEAVAGYRQAEALLKELADQFPDEADFRHKLARTEGHLSIDLGKLGRVVESEEAIRKGIALLTKLAEQYPNELRYRLDLAKNYNNLGNLREIQHREAEAEEFYRQALELKEKLVAEAGNAPLYHLEWAFTRAKMGQLLRKQGKYAESEKVFREVLKVQQEQLQKVPARPEDRNFLANSYEGLGIALAEQKQAGEAEKLVRQALEIRTKLTEDFPRVLEYRRGLATCYNDLGYLLGRQGKHAAAVEPYRQALELRKKIVAQAGPAPGYRVDLARSYHRLGYVLRLIHRPEEAEPACRAAEKVWKQLIADLPQVPDFGGGLANTYSDLAMLHNERRKHDAALALLEEARPHIQVALKARPKAFRDAYRDHLEALAATYRGLTDHAQVATTAEELARFGYQPARDTYNAACLLCDCATLAGKDGRLAEAKRRELAQAYADRALALLRQAVVRGFKDAAWLKKDPDLEPLRAREEFGKLVADLEAKTRK